MDDNKTRLDGSQSVFFENELESIDQRMYEVKHELLRGRDFLPKVLGIGEHDREYTYRVFESSGKAKVIANQADDVPLVNIEGADATSRIKPIALGYKFSVMDVQAAAAKGKSLDDLGARAVSRGIEEEIDDLLAFGSSIHAMTGFTNHALVDDTFTLGTKAGGGTTWANATAREMVDDVNNFVAGHWSALKDAQGIGGKLSVILPADEYAKLVNTPMGANADKSALDYLVKSPFIESVDYWHKLATAGDSSSPRMISYRKDPMVCGAVIPREQSPQPWEQRGLNLIRAVLASCGGAVVRFPVAVRYADGL